MIKKLISYPCGDVTEDANNLVKNKKKRKNPSVRHLSAYLTPASVEEYDLCQFK